jgi:hypothetical protein
MMVMKSLLYLEHHGLMPCALDTIMIEVTKYNYMLNFGVRFYMFYIVPYRNFNMRTEYGGE